MRTVLLSLSLVGLPGVTCAQDLSLFAVPNAEVRYELGGAASLSATVPPPVIITEPEPNSRTFRFPDIAPGTIDSDGASPTTFGDLSVFGGERREAGRDVLRLGTAITQGRTTTGVSVSYREDNVATRSEVFVDYALTDAFSMAISGIVTDMGGTAPEPVTRLGLSAAFATGAGSFVQGGIADAPDESPVFGLAVGLRF